MANMRTKTIAITLGLFLAAGMCYAADPWMGTWRLNEKKSKLSRDSGKNSTVTYASTMMGKVKITVDGTDSDGKPAHNSWTGKFDGKDYPVTGDPNSDTRSYRKIGDRTLELVSKKNGKTTSSGRAVLSADGKHRTVNTSGTNAKGKKFKVTAVYDKA